MKAMRLATAAILLCLAVPAWGQDNASFAAGLADRSTWERWFSTLQGDTRAGAYFWSGQRSLPNPQRCEDTTKMPADWQIGCRSARTMLTSFDDRRRADREYRRGWNSWQPASPTPPAASTTPAAPAAPQTNAEFTERDLRQIIDASQNNDLRFNRDYLNRSFEGRGSFLSVSSGFATRSFTATAVFQGREFSCSTSDQASLDQMADWNSGLPVVVSGRIARTVIGRLYLAPGCTIRAAR